MPFLSSLKRRLYLASLHLAASALVAVVVSLVVFQLWYPPPFAAISGGLVLMALLIGVDVVVGPALTAVAASPEKPRRELVRDLAIIISLQLAALSYGIYSLALARPIALVFEVDRMRVVTAADIEPTLLSLAPPALRNLSWAGPRLLAAPKPSDPAAQMRSIDLGLAGIDLAMDPRNWADYGLHRDAAWKAARPISVLLAKYPNLRPDVVRIASVAGLAPDSLRFLPLLSRHASWVTLLGPDARIVGHLPAEGFF
jgi:hypothetical protein